MGLGRPKYNRRFCMPFSRWLTILSTLLACNAGSGPGRPKPPVAPMQMPGSAAPSGRRQSIMDRVKRVASQPTLSGMIPSRCCVV